MRLEGNLFKDLVGSAYYVAPEVLRRSYGVDRENEQGIFDAVLQGNLDFAYDPWPSISSSAKDLIPTNVDGLIEYRAHPLWVQKYCLFHEHDGTPRCCSCERMEDEIVEKIAKQSQPNVINPRFEVQIFIDVLGKRSACLKGYGIHTSAYAT
ncbi:hypothetical protein RHMOL_Rhmol02G0118400 [Rhododendron molle]|uniref:Uncharacterized protein n=2 Tax=Rhododendron molle TaxID=49168 RepID=A0ACC0PNU0_RHOML|nr:hypothetical protein RHMOL_Rhmol02G0118400 [Rhododendron molle]KAI8567394.1 hypothetical protein RHMOL_Rhmol02G0118400 [Rhododendron molle]